MERDFPLNLIRAAMGIFFSGAILNETTRWGR
jgi:hypothetical protein